MNIKGMMDDWKGQIRTEEESGRGTKDRLMKSRTEEDE